MEKLVATFLLMVIFSCQATGTNESNGDKPKDQGIEINDIKACEALSKDQISDITGWDASSIVIEEMMNRTRLSVCSFRNGEEFILLRLAQKSDAAIANKVLENAYKNLLTESKDGHEYKSINDFTLFGTKTGPGGFHYYVLKSRNGNKSEVQIELSSKGSDDKALEKLSSVLEQLRQ